MKDTRHASHMTASLVGQLNWQLCNDTQGYLNRMDIGIEPGSKADYDLQSAENTLRELAEIVRHTREQLMIKRARAA